MWICYLKQEPDCKLSGCKLLCMLDTDINLIAISVLLALINCWWRTAKSQKGREYFTIFYGAFVYVYRGKILVLANVWQEHLSFILNPKAKPLSLVAKYICKHWRQKQLACKHHYTVLQNERSISTDITSYSFKLLMSKPSVVNFVVNFVVPLLWTLETEEFEALQSTQQIRFYSGSKFLNCQCNLWFSVS